MKKIVVLLCIVAILLSVATAAMASTAKWVVQFKAGSLTGGAMAGYASISTGANANASTALPNTWASTKANIASYVGSTFYSTEIKDSDIPAPYSYNMVVSMGADFAKEADGVTYKQVWITAWNLESSGFPSTTGWQLPAGYVLTVAKDGETLATWTHDDLYGVVGDTLAPGAAPAATAAARVGFWYTASASTGYATSTDRFVVTVANVPEPGSLLALGSGLVGMFGFVIRRRMA